MHFNPSAAPGKTPRDRDDFLIVLRPLAGHPVPAEARVKQLLKIALRGLRLECRAIIPFPGERGPTPLADLVPLALAAIEERGRDE
jgi:hypothetical protein